MTGGNRVARFIGIGSLDFVSYLRFYFFVYFSYWPLYNLQCGLAINSFLGLATSWEETKSGTQKVVHCESIWKLKSVYLCRGPDWPAIIEFPRITISPQVQVEAAAIKGRRAKPPKLDKHVNVYWHKKAAPTAWINSECVMCIWIIWKGHNWRYKLTFYLPFTWWQTTAARQPRKDPKKMGGGQENPDPKPENLNLNNEVIGRICLGPTTKVVGMRRL